MSIREMRKLRVIVPAGSEKAVLRGLQDLGCVQFTEPASFALPESTSETFNRMNTRLAESTNALSDVKAALEALKEYAGVKDGIFIKRKPVSEETFRSDSLEEKALEASGSIHDSLARLAKVRDERNVLEADLAMMETWENLDLDLSALETETTRVFPMAFPAATDTDVARRDAQEAGSSELLLLGQDKQQKYCALIVYKAHETAVLNALRPYSFSVVGFGRTAGTPHENIELIAKELEQNRAAEEELIRSINEEKGAGDVLRAYYDRLTSDVDLEKNGRNLITDETVSYFEGWVPQDSEDKVATFLMESRCAWETEEPKPEEYPDVPVSLRNNKLTSALSMVTEMYSLPAYGHVDPNPLMAPFFILFYGIMMADMAYGLVLFLAGLLISRKYVPKGTSGHLFSLMTYCGVSTFVFGALTGGFMGDFIPQLMLLASGKTVRLPALFSPLDDITMILIGSMALGLVQIITGMAISVVLKCRKEQYLDALFNEVTWWIVFAGLALMLLKVTAVVLIIGCALVILGPLVQGKGFGKITGIFSSLYSNVTGYFGDILSYTRLMALMLSGNVIAQVFNTLGALFGNVIMFVIIALIGNVFNMALNILGCYVHDLRLQCLEYFNKFYEDGGKPFEPLENRTKYVDIQ